MKIAIVDDIAEERSLLRSRLENQFTQRKVHAEIYEYESGEAFLDAAKVQGFAIVFLDIYMDGMTGMEAAAKLRVFDGRCMLIFTTTSTDHALEGFRVRAMHYLVKPYSEAELIALTEEILNRIPTPEKYIEVKVNGSNVRLAFRDIVYAEHHSHRMQIYTKNGKMLVTRQSFAEFTAPLKADDRFFLCSRGVIVNMEHADDFDGTAFVMDDGNTVFVSRDLLRQARQSFMDFLFKRGNT